MYTRELCVFFLCVPESSARGEVREEKYCVYIGGGEHRDCIGERGEGVEVRFDVYK